MRARLSLALIACIVTQTFSAQPQHDAPQAAGVRLAGAFRSGGASEGRAAQEETLVFPGMLRKEALEAGNPLATYAAMLDLEPQYRKSKVFVQIYPEISFNFE